MRTAGTAREQASLMAVGTLIDGRYRVLRALGWPGFGVWFEGHDTALDVPVTVLCLDGNDLSPEKVARCARDGVRMREGDGALRFQNVFQGSGVVSFMSERFEAEPLSLRREREGRLDPRWVSDMVHAVARVLAAAHAREVFHGCLTADQILCGTGEERDAPSFKVAGFGARWLIRDDAEAVKAVDDIRALAQIAGECLSQGGEPDSPEELRLEGSVRQLVTQAYVAAAPQGQAMLEEAWSGFRISVVPAREESRAPADPVSAGDSFAAAPTFAPAARRFDEEVQISVYRPKVIAPARWYKLLAYAHLAEKRPDDPAHDPDPVREVERRALAALGEAAKDYRSTTQDSLRGLPEAGEISFVPQVEGIEFNPRARTFAWLESVHEETFSLRAKGTVEGVLRGHLFAYLGPILLAEVPLSFTIDLSAGEAAKQQELSRARAYRKVFASYSRKDGAVVRHFDDVLATLGERYLIDVRDIRAGELWSPRLEELIREADVFQLFWSSSSMRSQFCRAEWEFALSLNRERFVRPVFWELPMPRDDGQGLPPPELDRIGFASFGQSGPAPRERSDTGYDSGPRARNEHSADDFLSAGSARLEALRQGELEKARQEAEHRARMEALTAQQAHEQQLRATGSWRSPVSISDAPRAARKSRLGVMAALSAATMSLCAGLLLFIAIKPPPASSSNPTPPIAYQPPTANPPMVTPVPPATESAVAAVSAVAPNPASDLRRRLTAARTTEGELKLRLNQAKSAAQRTAIEAELEVARRESARLQRQLESRPAKPPQSIRSDPF